MANIFGNLPDVGSMATANGGGIMEMFKNPQMANSLKGMAQNLQGVMSMGGSPMGGNPMEMIMSQMAQQNPMLSPIMGMLQSGQSPESIATSKLEELGINKNEFMREMQKMI